MAPSVIPGVATHRRARVGSSRKPLSSPFLQHQPLHSEQAVCATRAGKPVGSGSAGETECTHGFAVRISRNVPTRCSRNRRTRSGATATNDLALWGTVEDLFTRRLVGLVAIDRGHESVGIA